MLMASRYRFKRLTLIDWDDGNSTEPASLWMPSIPPKVVCLITIWPSLSILTHQ